MRVRLTERDWLLLHAIYARTLMSFRQIHAGHFAGRSKAVVHNRLTELAKTGFIERLKVGRILHHLEGREIGVVFRLTRRAIKLLQLKFTGRDFRSEPPPINTATIYHDLLIGDVLLALEKRFVGKDFLNGKLVAADFVNAGRLPDAVAEWPDKKRILAVELELTAKSEKRYRHIVTQYRMRQEFSGVLYVSAARPVREKIETVLTHKRVEGFAKPSTGKFYFADLQELLRNPIEAPITNGKDELSLPQSAVISTDERTTHGLKVQVA